jgi:hypothetical protein
MTRPWLNLSEAPNSAPQLRNLDNQSSTEDDLHVWVRFCLIKNNVNIKHSTQAELGISILDKFHITRWLYVIYELEVECQKQYI